MGISGSKAKKHLEAKFLTASKTGILNIENLDLKPESTIWAQMLLFSPDLVQTIKVLNISGNKLRKLPTEVAELVNLKKLHASKCSLQRMHNISGFVRLTHAVLDNNDLEESSIVQLPETLVHLDLSFNHISTLSNFISNLSNLVELNLSSNRLSTIEGVGILVRLEDLRLDDNSLEEIHQDIGHLSKLKYLSLKRNRLAPVSKATREQSIPETLFTATSVEHIDLQGNSELTLKILQQFNGVNVYFERIQTSRLKKFAGGAIVDGSIFGLD